jgi:AmiR/NasT family two-component response regulator
MGSANDDGLAVSQVPLNEIIRAMDSVHGLDISGYEPSFMARIVERRSQATGCDSAERYLAERLLGDLSEAEAFHRSLRVDYICEDRTLRNIPVVAVTASAMKGERESILAQGFDGYLSKPIEAERLKNRP